VRESDLFNIGFSMSTLSRLSLLEKSKDSSVSKEEGKGDEDDNPDSVVELFTVALGSPSSKTAEPR
jgi:hypothetical protein